MVFDFDERKELINYIAERLSCLEEGLVDHLGITTYELARDSDGNSHRVRLYVPSSKESRVITTAEVVISTGQPWFSPDVMREMFCTKYAFYQDKTLRFQGSYTGLHSVKIQDPEADLECDVAELYYWHMISRDSRERQRINDSMREFYDIVLAKTGDLLAEIPVEDNQH